MDGYVYYEGEGAWRGFRGNALNDNNTPYVSCQIHNQQSWTDMNVDVDGDGIPDGGMNPGGAPGQDDIINNFIIDNVIG